MKIKIKANDYTSKKLNDSEEAMEAREFQVTVDMTKKFYEDHEDRELETYILMDAVQDKLEEISADLDLAHIGFGYEGRPGYDFISDTCTLEHTRDLKHAIENYYGEWVEVQIIRER